MAQRITNSKLRLSNERINSALQSGSKVSKYLIEYDFSKFRIMYSQTEFSRNALATKVLCWVYSHLKSFLYREWMHCRTAFHEMECLTIEKLLSSGKHYHSYHILRISTIFTQKVYFTIFTLCVCQVESTTHSYILTAYAMKKKCFFFSYQNFF